MHSAKTIGSPRPGPTKQVPRRWEDADDPAGAAPFRTPRGPVDLRVIGLLVIASASLLACVFGGPAATALACLGSPILVFLLYPTVWWPASALTLLLLVPFAYAPKNSLFEYLVPGTIIMTGYVLVNLGRKLPWLRHGFAIIAGLLAIYFVLQIPFGGSDNNLRKLIWILLVLGTILLPFLVTSEPASFRPIICMVLVSGAIIATYGIAEFLSKFNILTDFFARSPIPLAQKWGSYRIFTIVGHPLVNATFLATAGSAALAVFLKWNHKLSLFVFALTSVSLIFTQSRTGLVALLVGIAVSIFGSLRGGSTRRVYAVACVLAFAALVFFTVDNPLVQRNSSTEGQGSSELRLTYIDNLSELLRAATLWGTGPGLSDSALQKAGGYAAGFPIESSLIQIIIGFGIVGASLFICIILGVLILSFRRGAVIGPSMLVAYWVAASGFNLLEAFPTLIAIPGVILCACVLEASLDGSSQAPLSRAGERWNVLAART